MSDYTIEHLRRHTSGRGETTLTVTVHYDTPWGEGLRTHYFTHTHTGVGFGMVHHTVSGNGYLGVLRDPQRFGDECDEQWVRNYFAHRQQARGQASA